MTLHRIEIQVLWFPIDLLEDKRRVGQVESSANKFTETEARHSRIPILKKMISLTSKIYNCLWSSYSVQAPREKAGTLNGLAYICFALKWTCCSPSGVPGITFSNPCQKVSLHNWPIAKEGGAYQVLENTLIQWSFLFTTLPHLLVVIFQALPMFPEFL